MDPGKCLSAICLSINYKAQSRKQGGLMPPGLHNCRQALNLVLVGVQGCQTAMDAAWGLHMLTCAASLSSPMTAAAGSACPPSLLKAESSRWWLCPLDLGGCSTEVAAPSSMGSPADTVSSCKVLPTCQDIGALTPKAGECRRDAAVSTVPNSSSFSAMCSLQEGSGTSVWAL